MSFIHRTIKYIFVFYIATLITSCAYLQKVERAFEYAKDDEKEKIPTIVAIPSKNPVEVRAAMLLPRSGKYSDIGKNIFDAAQLAIYELKAGDIKIEPIDIGSDKESAANALENFDASKIDILLGPIFSEQIPIVYDFAKKNSLITLSYSNDITFAHNTGLYLLGIMPEQQAVKIASYAGKIDFNNIYMIVANDKFGDAIEEALITNSAPLKYTVRKVQKYINVQQSKPLQGLELSQAALDIKYAINHDIKNYIPGFGRPAVLIPEGGTKLKKVVQQLSLIQDASKRDYKLLGIGNWEDYNLRPYSAYEGALVADIPNDILHQFENRFFEYYQYKPLRISSLAYDSVTLLAAIMNTTDSSIIIEFDKLQRSNGYKGVTGVFRLMPDGTNERKFSIYEMKLGMLKEIVSASNSF